MSVAITLIFKNHVFVFRRSRTVRNNAFRILKIFSLDYFDQNVNI